jgi:hypothetical protein
MNPSLKIGVHPGLSGTLQSISGDARLVSEVSGIALLGIG